MTTEDQSQTSRRWQPDFGEETSRHRLILILVMLLAAGLAARVGVRMAYGEEYFWKNSYSFLYAAAERLASGHGFCFESICQRPPIYTAFLAITTLFGKNYLLIVVPQALLGGGVAFFAFLIGRHIFDTATGIVACAITAFYPYYVMHDTALQDTVMGTFWIALSIWLLLRASRQNHTKDWFLAGAALGAIALARASAAPIVAVALLWTMVWGAPGNIRKRLQASIILLLAFTVILMPWLIYTYRISGTATLSSDSGYLLWVSNNPETFSHYPAESIDQSTAQARSKMTQDDLAQLGSLSGNRAATSNWFIHRALDFVFANPGLTLQRMFRKLAAAFSWRLSPYREPLAQTIYAIGYVPVALLGILGMFMARRKPETILIGMLFLAFMAVTAVFFAHTSHRSYLDVYWIVFAAAALLHLWTSVTRKPVKSAS